MRMNTKNINFVKKNYSSREMMRIVQNFIAMRLLGAHGPRSSSSHVVSAPILNPTFSYQYRSKKSSIKTAANLISCSIILHQFYTLRFGVKKICLYATLVIPPFGKDLKTEKQYIENTRNNIYIFYIKRVDACATNQRMKLKTAGCKVLNERNSIKNLQLKHRRSKKKI